MKKCPNCNSIYTDNDFYCLKCNHKLEILSNAMTQTKQECVPKCPICQSTNLSKISAVKKAGKIGLFGIFGAGDIGKTYKCNNCGSKF